MTNNSASLPRPTRLRAALRQAIDLRIAQGMTVTAACREAGMSHQGFHKAMKRPEVVAYYERKQMEFVACMESDRTVNKARAYQVGVDLMENSKSDSVRAKMVEFFLAGDKKPALVTINNVMNSGGYEYPRPDQNIVEIRDAEEVSEHPFYEKRN